MKILNKKQSDECIKHLSLNRMNEVILQGEDNEQLINWYFENRNSKKLFNIRDKSKNGGKFLYKLTPFEVFANLPKVGTFSVYESLHIADQHLILQGDIEISKDFIMKASLDDRLGISNRIAMQQPKWSFYNYDLRLKPDPTIKGFKDILAYICQHELIGMIIEFSLYEIPVGIFNEPVIIWELRNY